MAEKSPSGRTINLLIVGSVILAIYVLLGFYAALDQGKSGPGTIIIVACGVALTVTLYRFFAFRRNRKQYFEYLKRHPEEAPQEK
ncbi:MAG TPA: hypothetical protein VJN71_02915 [Nitrososphaerales archaeon]|nr:hypothetical protein [Nitrososphaerales archaeon]